MATWEDGPEYAPVERPADFAVSPAPPLSQATPYQQMAGLAPKNRPQFVDPPATVAPLADLHPAVEAPRDPQLPFDVASSTMTTESAAWGATHWSPPSGKPVGGAGPAVAAPAYLPQQPILLTSPQPTSGPTGLPAPGTPGWFGPSAYGQPVDQKPLGARQVFQAATPGLLITLLIGALVYVVAPITFIVGFALSRRIQVASRSIRNAWSIGLAAFVMIALLRSLGSTYSFSDWWGSIGVTALLASWVMLVVTVLIVRNGLARGEGQAPPPPPRPWG